jgi:LPS-assembly lipoprotein
MTHKNHSLILIGLTAILLSGCGFKPMYGSQSHQTDAAIPSQLSQIAIDIIPDREGQTLRNALIDRLYQNGYPNAPIATLKISKIEEVRNELDLTKSSDATRAQLRMSGTMTLTDKSGAVVLTRTLKTITSFNILGSEFATRVTEESARESGLQDLARQVELNLSLYYNSKP